MTYPITSKKPIGLKLTTQPPSTTSTPADVFIAWYLVKYRMRLYGVVLS